MERERQILKNDKYTYISPKSRGQQKIKKIIKNGECEELGNLFYRELTTNTKNNTFKSKILNIVNPVIRYVKRQRSSVFKRGISELGSGEQGAVYLACIDDKCKQKVTIKTNKTKDDAESLLIEYTIMKRLAAMKTVTPHVVYPYGVVACDGNTNIRVYAEYIPGGDLLGWIKKVTEQRPLPDYVMAIITFQILYTLHVIRKKYPSFRHNDLHIGNVFINDEFTARGKIEYNFNGKKYMLDNVGVNAVVADLGFAYMNENPKNPMVTGNQYRKDYGIYVGNSEKYDHHFFLNSLYSTRRKLPSAMVKFLDDVLPPAYRGEGGGRGSPIKNSRLRAGVDHKAMPSLVEVMMHPFLQTFRSTASKEKVVDKFGNGVPIAPPRKFSRANLMRMRPATNNANTRRQVRNRVVPTGLAVPSPPKRTAAQIKKEVDAYVRTRNLRTMRFGDLVNAIVKPGENRAEIRKVVEAHTIQLVTKDRKDFKKVVTIGVSKALETKNLNTVKSYLHKQMVPPEIIEKVVTLITSQKII